MPGTRDSENLKGVALAYEELEFDRKAHRLEKPREKTP